MANSPDNSLQILIEVLTKEVGQQKAADILDKCKSSAASLSQEMGVVTVSGEEAEKILGKTGDKAEMSHHSMRRLANTMGSEIPGAAALMEAGFEASENTMMSSTFLLLAGIEMLRSAIKRINEEKAASIKIEESLTDAEKQTTDGIDGQREALEKAEVSEAEFYHNLTRNIQNAIGPAERLAAAVLKTVNGVGESGISKRKDIAAKEIEDMEQRGVISHAAALKMKEQLDIEYEQNRALRMMATDKLEEIEMRRQLGNKQIAARNAEQAEPAAESRYVAATKASAANNAKIEDAKAKIKAGEDAKKSLRDTGVTEDTIQQLREMFTKITGKDAGSTSLSEQFHELAKIQTKRTVLGAGALGPIGMAYERYGSGLGQLLNQFGSQGDRNLGLYQGADLDISGGKLDLARATKNKTGLDIEEGNSRSDLDLARSQMEKLRTEVRELQDKITETDATNAIKEGGAKSDLGMSRANAALISDHATADKVQAGRPVSNVDAQKMMSDASRIAGHQVDLAAAAQIIENGANNIGIFMNQVGRMANAMQSLNPNAIADLQQQINQLVSQNLTRKY